MSLRNEKKIPIKQVASLCVSPVTYGTILRWCVEGILIPGTQQRVRLERTRDGGRWFTSREAYQRFIDKQNGKES